MGNQLLEKWSNEYDVSVIEEDAQVIKRLKKKKINILNIQKRNDKNFLYIVLCTKPDDFKNSIEKFKQYIQNGQKIISVMAGLNIKYIKRLIKCNVNIIRMMPNLYCGLGLGVCGVFCEKPIEKKKINSLLHNLGHVIWLNKESDIDFITAFFGGAPAYFFLFLETLKKILERNKITPSLENILILKLLSATSEYLRINKSSFDKLISKVASKGGTTEEALKFLNAENKFYNLFEQAIDLAKDKSKILGSKYTKN